MHGIFKFVHYLCKLVQRDMIVEFIKQKLNDLHTSDRRGSVIFAAAMYKANKLHYEGSQKRVQNRYREKQKQTRYTTSGLQSFARCTLLNLQNEFAHIIAKTGSHKPTQTFAKYLTHSRTTVIIVLHF